MPKSVKKKSNVDVGDLYTIFGTYMFSPAVSFFDPHFLWRRKEWEEALAARRGTAKRCKDKKAAAATVLNNKSSLLAGVQKGLADSGTKRYVDSDSD